MGVCNIHTSDWIIVSLDWLRHVREAGRLEAINRHANLPHLVHLHLKADKIVNAKIPILRGHQYGRHKYRRGNKPYLQPNALLASNRLLCQNLSQLRLAH